MLSGMTGGDNWDGPPRAASMRLFSPLQMPHLYHSIYAPKNLSSIMNEALVYYNSRRFLMISAFQDACWYGIYDSL